jgi:hypothetical protein
MKAGDSYVAVREGRTVGVLVEGVVQADPGSIILLVRDFGSTSADFPTDQIVQF